VAEKWGEGMKDGTKNQICFETASSPSRFFVVLLFSAGLNSFTVKITRITILDCTTFAADECRDGLCILMKHFILEEAKQRGTMITKH
jgi:hypothetical protein